MPDFSQPGKDGALPAGVPEWRDGLGSLTTRGLIYLGRGARDVVPCDRTYRITASWKQTAEKGAPFTGYADLYRHVARLTEARAAEMSCAHGEPLHARIAGHSWTSLPGASHDFPMAALVTDLTCSRQPRAEGEPSPAPDAFTVPGGTPRDEFSRIATRPSEEFYNEYDVGGPGANTEPVSFSYGEHVETCAGIDYQPFVDRAEHRARFHHSLLATPQTPFVVLRRDWWAVPDTLVVVVIYFL